MITETLHEKSSNIYRLFNCLNNVHDIETTVYVFLLEYLFHLKTNCQLLFLTSFFFLPAQKCHKFTKLNIGHAIIGTSLRVRLLLYTRDNSTCGTLMSHTNLSASPQLNLSRPTTFIIHGFRPTGSPPLWLDELTDALLAWKDINVIVVDWNHGSANSYFKAVENTKKAADNITAFIEMMQVWDVTIWPLLLCLDRLNAGLDKD